MIPNGQSNQIRRKRFCSFICQHWTRWPAFLFPTWHQYVREPTQNRSKKASPHLRTTYRGKMGLGMPQDLARTWYRRSCYTRKVSRSWWGTLILSTISVFKGCPSWGTVNVKANAINPSGVFHHISHLEYSAFSSTRASAAGIYWKGNAKLMQRQSVIDDTSVESLLGNKYGEAPEGKAP